jgi:hypothetical protein
MSSYGDYVLSATPQFLLLGSGDAGKIDTNGRSMKT